MKSYTDLEQSKKLAEFLPFKSADMRYVRAYFEGNQSNWFVNLGKPIKSDDVIPCWSLAALLAVLDEPYLFKKFCTWSCYVFNPNNHRFISTDLAEPVDACVELIEKLHEQKFL